MSASLSSSATTSSTTPVGRERKYLLTIIVLHLLAITLPYLWCASLVPNEQIWGGLLYNPDDQNVHLSWARQAAQGHFFFRDLFTTENLSDGSRPFFTNLLCWALGALSTITHLPLVAVYHGIRIGCAGLGLWWFWRLCRHFSDDSRVRLVAVSIAAFGGGFGWMRDLAPALMAGRILIDRPDGQGIPMMPEAFGFASSFIFPLNIAAMALLVAVYEQILQARHSQARHSQARRNALLAAGTAFLLSNIHTYDALPLCLVLLIGTVYRERRQSTLIGSGEKPQSQEFWARAAPLCAIVGAALPVLYQLIVYRNSEEFRIKALTPTPAPPLLDIACSYGPWLLLALAGVGITIRERNFKVLWPALWLIVTFVMIYTPVSFARKMIEGVHWPLAFFAAVAVVRATAGVNSSSLRRLTALGVIAVLSISSWQFVFWCIGPNWADNNLSRGPMMPPLRFSRGDWAALQWLDAQGGSKYSGAVLCFPKLGNYVPRETGRNVWIGHWAETLNVTGQDGKLAQIVRYYSGQMSRETALSWLHENHIGVVIEGEYERALFGGNLPSAQLGLKPLYNENGTAIYVVP